MLIPYTAQTFGEPLAVAAFGGMAMAALRADRMSPWLIPLTFAATVSKDTAAPFVILVVLAGIVMSGSEPGIARRCVRGLALGVALGLAATVAFNVFRYGSLTNTSYLKYPFASVGMAGNNILGLLVSPNGGIAWFWPGTIIAAAVLAVTLVHGAGDRRDPIRIGPGWPQPWAWRRWPGASWCSRSGGSPMAGTHGDPDS